jgi:heme exporter protein D
MTAGEVAAVITGATALFTALATAITNLAVLVSVLRSVRSTHTIVNQQRTDAAAYQAITTGALREAGIDVPADPSLGAPETPPGRGG